MFINEAPGCKFGQVKLSINGILIVLNLQHYKNITLPSLFMGLIVCRTTRGLLKCLNKCCCFLAKTRSTNKEKILKQADLQYWQRISAAGSVCFKTIFKPSYQSEPGAICFIEVGEHSDRQLLSSSSCCWKIKGGKEINTAVCVKRNLVSSLFIHNQTAPFPVYTLCW